MGDDMGDGNRVLRRILDLLEGADCAYERFDHPAVSTAQEAAVARDTALADGTKAIVLKYDDQFGIFALNATRQIRSAHIRRALRVKRTRFASREELSTLTGLVPGAVPPFGPPVLPLPLFVDPSAIANEAMLFTAGSRTTSLRIATDHYRRIVQPRIVSFAR